MRLHAVSSGSTEARRPTRTRCILATAILLACTAAGAQVPKQPAPSPQAPSPQALVRRPAPAFVLQDLRGQPLSLVRLRGKVVLLNFWASWCGPCLTEMPEFMQWQRQFAAQGLQVVGISMDDDSAAARKMADKLKVDYPIAMGDVRLGQRYGGVLGLPLSFLVDRKGEVRAVYQGISNLPAIEKQVRALLAER